MNKGKVYLTDDYTAFICKGSRLERYKVIEKLVSDTRVSVLFQKNTWVKTGILIDLVKAFIEYIEDKHNGLWILLYCDDLTTHVNNTVKSIFAAGKIFLYYFSSSTTELAKLIDTGYSRPL